MKKALLIVTLFCSVLCSQQFTGVLSNTFVAQSPTANLLAPTAYWVLSGGTTINSLTGTHVLTTQTGTGGPNLVVNVGGPDGQGILTGRTASNVSNVYNYYLDTTSTSDLTMSNTSATVMVCGRPQPWEVNSSNSAIPTSGVGAMRKTQEWNLALNASGVTPFQVTVGGTTYSAGNPPAMSSFASNTRPYPTNSSGIAAYQCTFGIYNRSTHIITASFNDGPEGSGTAVGADITLGASGVRVAESALASELSVAAFWPVVLTQQERATIWNGMIRNPGATFGYPALTSWPTYQINPATDLGDNAWSQSYGSYTRESEFATFKFIVTPQGSPSFKPAIVTKFSTLYGSGVRTQAEHDIGIRMDGAYFGYDYPLQIGQNYSTFALPNDGNPHTIELRVGSIGASVYTAANNPQDTLEGASLEAVSVPPGYTITPVAPTATSTTFVYVDSIGGGTNAEAVSSPYLQLGPRVNMAWNQLCRYSSPTCFPTTNLATEGYGGRLLNNDCPTQTACNAFFDNVVAKYKNIQIMWAAIGINDVSHGNSSICLAGFTNEYTWLTNAFHARYPTGQFYAQSMLNTSAVTTDSASGCSPTNTVAAYRTAIQNVCTAAGAWCHFVDGTAAGFPQLGQTPAQISADNLHPSAYGYILYAMMVASIMGNGASITYPQ